MLFDSQQNELQWHLLLLQDMYKLNQKKEKFWVLKDQFFFFSMDQIKMPQFVIMELDLDWNQLLMKLDMILKLLSSFKPWKHMEWFLQTKEQVFFFFFFHWLHFLQIESNFYFISIFSKKGIFITGVSSSNWNDNFFNQINQPDKPSPGNSAMRIHINNFELVQSPFPVTYG